MVPTRGLFFVTYRARLCNNLLLVGARTETRRWCWRQNGWRWCSNPLLIGATFPTDFCGTTTYAGLRAQNVLSHPHIWRSAHHPLNTPQKPVIFAVLWNRRLPPNTPPLRPATTPPTPKPHLQYTPICPISQNPTADPGSEIWDSVICHFGPQADPLLIGALVHTHQQVEVTGRVSEFQSPTHRGFGPCPQFTSPSFPPVFARDRSISYSLAELAWVSGKVAFFRHFGFSSRPCGRLQHPEIGPDRPKSAFAALR